MEKIYNLKILSGWESDRAMIKVIKAGLATVIMITVGDYCSVTTGVLHKGRWVQMQKCQL
jgi:hypothetical protein